MSESLPARPNLNWLKNRAKERLAELKAQDPKAKLAEAQLLLARAYGFKSWRSLVAKVRKEQAEAPEAGPPKQATPQDEDLLRQFRGAVNAGRLEEVRTLLETQPLIRQSVNAPIFAFGGRPIAQAKRNRELVDLLLAHGADINLKSDWWAGPWGILEDADAETAAFLISRGAVVDIFAAAHLGRLERVEELLDAHPDLVHAKGGDGRRPLHCAKSLEMIELLLERGADINARCVDHEGTAAQWAVPGPPRQQREKQIDRDLQRVAWLVDRGATADVFMAAALDDAPRLGALLEADPTAMDARVGARGYGPCPAAPGGHIYIYTLGDDKTAFEVAAEFGSEACLKLLRDRSTPRQRFLGACSTADRAAAEAAIADQPGLVASLSRDDQGRLPKAAFDGKQAAVALMLDLGFDPLASGPDTGTVLHCAAWQGQAGIVELVLEHPAVRPVLDKLINAIEPTHKSTPLGWCCHGSTVCRNPRGDYPKVARMLLAAGGTPAHNRGDASAAVKAELERAA